MFPSKRMIYVLIYIKYLLMSIWPDSLTSCITICLASSQIRAPSDIYLLIEMSQTMGRLALWFFS